jgi:hypothetical protein
MTSKDEFLDLLKEEVLNLVSIDLMYRSTKCSILLVTNLLVV